MTLTENMFGNYGNSAPTICLLKSGFPNGNVVSHARVRPNVLDTQERNIVKGKDISHNSMVSIYFK